MRNIFVFRPTDVLDEKTFTAVDMNKVHAMKYDGTTLSLCGAGWSTNFEITETGGITKDEYICKITERWQRGTRVPTELVIYTDAEYPAYGVEKRVDLSHVVELTTSFTEIRGVIIDYKLADREQHGHIGYLGMMSEEEAKRCMEHIQAQWRKARGME